MTSARFIIGDTRDVTRTLPDGSVDLILTSPPFLALRSYLPDDHPNKAREIGSEGSPAEFLDVMLDLVELWARKLAPHGSLVVELGDTYAGSGSPGGDYNEGGMRAGQPRTTYSGRRAAGDTVGERFERHEHAKYDRVIVSDAEGRRAPIRNLHGKTQPGGNGWPLDKSLCGIPQLFELSLIYGRNMLRPERTTEPWRVRNLIAWCRPNPPVGALSDKFRPATSYIVVATKARDRWFDLDAVRVPYALAIQNNEGTGAPPLDWWQVSTEPYAGAHYATWPRKLLERPIKAMCPERVCTTCGEPSRRVVETEHEPNRTTNGPQSIDRKHVDGGSPGFGVRAERVVTATTWTDCGHGTWRPGVVLDPFAGSGTTLAVATGHGRDAIGIDLDERNADLALARVGPLFLTVEHHDQDAVA